MPTETTPAVPMTIEERAREVLAELGVDDDLDGDSLATVAEALRTVRNEALEQAENLIIEAALDDAIRRHLRKAIRSLKESP